MTRINCGIPPKDLTDQHLLAELRELPRIPNAVKKKIKEGKEIGKIPSEFCLGTGHVCFFYNKLDYLHARYVQLVCESGERGIKHNVYYDLFYMEGVNDNKLLFYYNEYIPTEKDRELIKERIATRITESKQIPRYYGKPVSKDHYIKNILKY